MICVISAGYSVLELHCGASESPAAQFDVLLSLLPMLYYPTEFYYTEEECEDAISGSVWMRYSHRSHHTSKFVSLPTKHK